MQFHNLGSSGYSGLRAQQPGSVSRGVVILTRYLPADTLGGEFLALENCDDGEGKLKHKDRWHKRPEPTLPRP